MENNHTPGPWQLEMGQAKDLFYVYGDGYVYVASNEHCDAEEVIGNAYLIAAAPELLDACERVLADAKSWSRFGDVQIDEDDFPYIKDVIAKAKGKARE